MRNTSPKGIVTTLRPLAAVLPIAYLTRVRISDDSADRWVESTCSAVAFGVIPQGTMLRAVEDGEIGDPIGSAEALGLAAGWGLCRVRTARFDVRRFLVPACPEAWASQLASSAFLDDAGVQPVASADATDGSLCGFHGLKDYCCDTDFARALFSRFDLPSAKGVRLYRRRSFPAVTPPSSSHSSSTGVLRSWTDMRCCELIALRSECLTGGEFDMFWCPVAPLRFGMHVGDEFVPSAAAAVDPLQIHLVICDTDSCHSTWKEQQPI